MSWLTGFWQRLRRMRLDTDRLVRHSERLNERQRRMTIATGNIIERDIFEGGES